MPRLLRWAARLPSPTIYYITLYYYYIITIINYKDITITVIFLLSYDYRSICSIRPESEPTPRRPLPPIFYLRPSLSGHRTFYHTYVFDTHKLETLVLWTCLSPQDVCFPPSNLTNDSREGRPPSACSPRNTRKSIFCSLALEHDRPESTIAVTMTAIYIVIKINKN